MKTPDDLKQARGHPPLTSVRLEPRHATQKVREQLSRPRVRAPSPERGGGVAVMRVRKRHSGGVASRRGGAVGRKGRLRERERGGGISGDGDGGRAPAR